MNGGVPPPSPFFSLPLLFHSRAHFYFLFLLCQPTTPTPIFSTLTPLSLYLYCIQCLLFNSFKYHPFFLHFSFFLLPSPLLLPFSPSPILPFSPSSLTIYTLHPNIPPLLPPSLSPTLKPPSLLRPSPSITSSPIAHKQTKTQTLIDNNVCSVYPCAPLLQPPSPTFAHRRSC